MCCIRSYHVSRVSTVSEDLTVCIAAGSPSVEYWLSSSHRPTASSWSYWMLASERPTRCGMLLRSTAVDAGRCTRGRGWRSRAELMCSLITRAYAKEAKVMPRVVAACGHVLLCSPPEKRVPHGLVYAAVHQCHCPETSQCRAYVTSWSCTNAGVMIDNAGTGGACFCLVEDEDRSTPDSAAALLASYFPGCKTAVAGVYRASPAAADTPAVTPVDPRCNIGAGVRWNADEDSRLRSAMQSMHDGKTTWENIVDVFPARTHASIKKRWSKLQKKSSRADCSVP